MSGRLTIPPFPAVTIDPRRDGDIDWSFDPYHHPSWLMTYRMAGWAEALIEGYLDGGPRAAAYARRAKALLRDWLRDVPVAGRDPSTLVCAAHAFPAERWIRAQVPPTVNYYARHWMGAWNHGLKQDIQLLQIGCGFPGHAMGGSPLKWRHTARQQMAAAFAPGPLGPAIDAQGAVNEQSTGYANFTYRLWTTAEHDLQACGLSVPKVISTRVALLPGFLAQAVQPDGTLVQLGDTYVERPHPGPPGSPLLYAATRGTAGSPPAQRVAVYRAGYVFGRSGWGISRPFSSESFYSLRFGPGRQVHGHEDHMSVTYYARGRNLLADSGHTGYETGRYRAYLRSPMAHNVLVMPGVPFTSAASTTLTRRSVGADGQFFEFADRAYGGNPRVRSIYISQRPDLMLVFDRASGAARYQQLWHLDPGLKVTTVGRTYAAATAGATRLLIHQIPLPGQRIPAGSTQVVRGKKDPYQGWVSRGMLERTPAPVVTMTRTGHSAAILTLIAPVDRSVSVTATMTAGPGGWYRLRLRLGGSSPAATAFLVSPGGYIKRG